MKRKDREREPEKGKSSLRNSLPNIPPFNTAGATSTVLEAEDLTNGERRALKVGILRRV